MRIERVGREEDKSVMQQLVCVFGKGSITTRTGSKKTRNCNVTGRMLAGRFAR